MSTISNKINFWLEGSLVDLIDQKVPNWNCPSSRYLERKVDGALQTYIVSAFHPAFYAEDGAFLLEPYCVNLITQNINLSDPLWQKGSNLSVRSDYTVAPDGTLTADRLTWSSGDGPSQILRRSLALNPGSIHYLSLFLRSTLKGGQFASTDVIRVTGDVIGTPQLSLSVLNSDPGQYQIDGLELAFQTTGRHPVIPNNPHQAISYPVTAISGATVTLQLVVQSGGAVATNDLTGGQLSFNNVPGKTYKVVANTSSSNNLVTVTVDANTLVSDGVSTSSYGTISDAPLANINIELYSESTAAIEWGGVQLEERPFRTSMVLQEDAVVVRGECKLNYRRSPIQNLKTFGVFADLKEWRGDGYLFDFGNFDVWLAGGVLYVQAGSTTLQSRSQIPKKECKIFLQVSEETGFLSMFVNGVLEAKTSVGNFVADAHAVLNLKSDGVRAYYRSGTFNATLLDGQPVVGQPATLEVATLFNEDVLVDPEVIASRSPVFTLPPVVVPPATQPIASSTVQGVSAAQSQLTVADGTNFVNNTPVVVVRNVPGYGQQVIIWANQTNKSGNVITLSSISGAVIGDTLIYGTINQPGQASVRFPFDPVDSQTILEVDVANSRIRVGSTLSFAATRGFIHTPLYQDIAEVLVKSIDPISGYLVCNPESLSLISVGDTFSQPLNELWVDPANYIVSLARQVDGLQVYKKYVNGIVLQNTKNVPLTAKVAVKPEL